MKQFATLLVGTSVAVFLALGDVGENRADHGFPSDDMEAGAIADARGLPNGHPSISGFPVLPEGHPPLLPEGHPPLSTREGRCPRSALGPWLQPGDAVREPREASDIVAI